MGLSDRFARRFRRGVRVRGLAYFRRGAVAIHEGSPRHARATVQGTSRYPVSIEIRSGSIHVECSCPFFAQHGPCKHAWAALLAAEAEGFLDAPSDAAAGGNGHGSAAPPPRAARDARRRSSPPRRPTPPRAPDGAPPPTGETPDDDTQDDPDGPAAPGPMRWPPYREILYVLDAASTEQGQLGLELLVAWRERRRDGRVTAPRIRNYLRLVADQVPDPADRAILPRLLGGGTDAAASRHGFPTRHTLPPALQEALIPDMCRTGRCMLRAPGGGDWTPLHWDDGAPWDAWLEIRPDPSQDAYVLTGSLRRDRERMTLAEAVHITSGGLLLTRTKAGRFQDFGAFPWMGLVRAHGPVRIPAAQIGAHVGQILTHPRVPRLELPPELHYEEVREPPRPRLIVRRADGRIGSVERLRGELSFAYGTRVVETSDVSRGIYIPEEKRLIVRDLAAEQEARALLPTVGFRVDEDDDPLRPRPEILPSKMAEAVRELLTRGWHVEAEGVTYRRAGNFSLRVSSGVDWFDLDGGVEFDGRPVPLPELLAALRKGDGMIRLGDGSMGLLPEEWMKRYGLLAGAGALHEGKLRFGRSQVGVLDALLGEQSGASWDTTFAKAREELRSFDRVRPGKEPAGFRGTLRPYQREGLGWLQFLEKMGFGGCLADDMGLGKTVQVLALLEARRTRRPAKGAAKAGATRRTSLVVMPRSLLFNWRDEATRFAPGLSVLQHFGPGRRPPGAHFADHDVVFTTYGTLRRDIEAMRTVKFAYVILDEAQTIKNADTESSKAARLVQADHRLALSGTPVENHLGELWSLFEFINPGMLGALPNLKLPTGDMRDPPPETREALARAVRPFLLRRTKGQVAKDLPPRTEQTIHCEMDDAEQARYEELRKHYRDVLLHRVERDGLGKSAMHVLEALLRLRQAACHPGLMDPARAGDPSAKLDTFLERIGEILSEGHKALVYSQFTTFLGIVRQRLDERKIVYEYLDGKTRDRAARVERFQTDPDCPLFLLSLKAGGVGLNLTAAEYVFLLDPWWNPAVEAQAMDRAHRIGQRKAVFAYRLITKGTVEEKVLSLQETKKGLADAILEAGSTSLRELSREDLEFLLS